MSLHFSPLLGATGIEGLIFILIALASAFFNWLKKRKEDSDWTEVEQPRSQFPPRTSSAPSTERPASPTRKTSDWEEELRRMLEGTAVPSSPPPIIREQKPPPPIPHPPVYSRPAPRPTMAVPKVFEETKIYKGHCEHCGGHIEFASEMAGDYATCPHCSQQTALEPIQESRLEKVMHRTELAVLEESASAYQRAEHLDQAVAARMQQTISQPVQMTHMQDFRKRSAEIDQVLALLRKPQTARQAILAGVILGPPKAFEGA